ncbi:MAG: hypothetical protein LBR85_09370 [Oscillospiraceae bacterium]|jgi:NADPH-dependent ferric siderophore reductase|nr:hypothetical protein [Oscillospiraceae bacterium]
MASKLDVYSTHKLVHNITEVIFHGKGCKTRQKACPADKPVHSLSAKAGTGSDRQKKERLTRETEEPYHPKAGRYGSLVLHAAMPPPADCRVGRANTVRPYETPTPELSIVHCHFSLKFFY